MATPSDERAAGHRTHGGDPESASPPDVRAAATPIKGRPVLGIGGPNSGTGSHDGQSALKLHRGISVLAFLLCVLVTVVFLMDHAVVWAIVFAVVALACVGIFGWTSVQLRRATGTHDPGREPYVT
ncbi:hypothetical protein GCM10023215_22770 [Pseudonocardia yuanmonensis]|uniref:Uncharacterized protein n=1 Tax=Pseudonocardia yuanmonensis TaxID=1095914 RepID=A0ABP8WF05_9PSEU